MPGYGNQAKPGFWNTMIPLGKQICISFSGTWLNLEVSPQWRGWAHDQSSQTSRQPRSSTFSMLGIRFCLFQKFRTSHLEVQWLWGHYLISNTLATLKTGFMVTNEPLISNFVFEFQFASAFFFFKVRRSRNSPILFTSPSCSCFHLFSPEFCSDVILWLAEGHSGGNIHRTDNALPLSTGRRPPASVVTQQWAPGWGTGAFLGKALPVINTQENNLSLSRGLESAAQA